MSSLMIILLAIGALLILSMLWSFGVYNYLVRLKSLLDEAFSGIDVQLKRRADLVPNLVAVVKQYGVHEKEIFEKIAQARSASLNAHGVQDSSTADNTMTQALRTLFAVAENYPDLKANQNFLALQQDLNSIEHDLQLARRYYNGTARNYNVAVNSFPSRIVASLTHFRPATYFEVSRPEERENVQVRF